MDELISKKGETINEKNYYLLITTNCSYSFISYF